MVLHLGVDVVGVAPVDDHHAVEPELENNLNFPPKCEKREYCLPRAVTVAEHGRGRVERGHRRLQTEGRGAAEQATAALPAAGMRTEIMVNFDPLFGLKTKLKTSYR